MDLVKNGCGQSGHGTLKLTVSQKWTGFLHDGTNFKKVKNEFNDFLVGMVKNDHGLLVHETLKFAAS